MNKVSPSSPSANSLGKAYAVDFLTGITAGALYHPWRVMADRVITKDKTPFHPKMLVRGIRYTLLSSHQLVLMGFAMSTFDRLFPEETENLSNKKIVKAVTAGCVTTLTTTPFDVFLAQGALSKNIYRGFTATLCRQAVLGLGFFVFPKIYREQLDRSSEGLKALCNFAGGITATVLSHPFDMARVKMQKDIFGEQFPKFRDAMRHTLTKESKETVVRSLGLRFGIVGVASLVMNLGREAWGGKS
jgi:hypothetical protein